MIDLNTIPKYVINIKERTERLSQFRNEIGSFFLNQDVIVTEACVGKPSMKFIGLSHKKCVQHAKDNRYNEILIMEDDVKLIPNSFDYAQECLNNLPNDWDILLGGIYTSRSLVKENEFWNKTGYFSALHFYIINKNAYDKFLSIKEDIHIDVACAKNKHLGGVELNCYVMNQFVAIQHNGYSDNVDKVMDYSHLLKNFKIYGK